MPTIVDPAVTNLIKGASYRTHFLAEKTLLRKPSGDSRFWNYTPGFTGARFAKGTLDGLYRFSTKEWYAEWSVSDLSDGIFVDTPEVDDAVPAVMRIIERANPDTGISPLTTLILGKDSKTSAPSIYGVAKDEAKDIVSDVVDSAGNAVNKLTEGLSGITTPILVILGIIAVGLAYGLSKSRANI